MVDKTGIEQVLLLLFSTDMYVCIEQVVFFYFPVYVLSIAKHVLDSVSNVHVVLIC